MNKKKMANVIGLTGLLLSTYQVASASEIFNPYRSARYLGLGDAGISIASGVDAIFYNPAGIAENNGILNEIALISPQLSTSIKAREIYEVVTKNKNNPFAIINSIKNEPLHVGAQNFTGVAFKRAAFGLFQKTQSDLFIGTNPDTGILGASLHSYTLMGIYGSLARGFINDILLIGTTVKFLGKGQGDLEVDSANFSTQFKNANTNELLNRYVKKGAGIGADLGVTLLSKEGANKPRISLVLRDIANTCYSFKIGSQGPTPECEKQKLDMGFSFLSGTKRSNLTFLIDVKDLFNAGKETIYKRLHLGSQLIFDNIFGVMGGINQGYPTYGAFLTFKIIRVEGGVYSEELDRLPGDRRSQRAFARIILGWTK